MKHEERAQNFRETLTWLDRFTAPPNSTVLLGKIRRTRGSCSNCRRRSQAMLFTRGNQICGRCISAAADSFPHAATRMAIIRGIRRLTRAA